MSSSQTHFTYAELQQFKKLEQALKTLRPECPACGRMNMAFKGMVQLGNALGPYGVVGTKDERMARRVCGDCGHVMLFELTEKLGDDRPRTISD